MKTSKSLAEKLDELEFVAGFASFGLAGAEHSIYEYNNHGILTRGIREQMANVIAGLGVDSLENARKTFRLGPYPYGEVIGYIAIGGLLVADNLLRRYRGRGLIEMAYSRLNDMSQYIKTNLYDSVIARFS